MYLSINVQDIATYLHVILVLVLQPVRNCFALDNSRQFSLLSCVRMPPLIRFAALKAKPTRFAFSIAVKRFYDPCLKLRSRLSRLRMLLLH